MLIGYVNRTICMRIGLDTAVEIAVMSMSLVVGVVVSVACESRATLPCCRLNETRSDAREWSILLSKYLIHKAPCHFVSILSFLFSRRLRPFLLLDPWISPHSLHVVERVTNMHNISHQSAQHRFTALLRGDSLFTYSPSRYIRSTSKPLASLY